MLHTCVTKQTLKLSRPQPRLSTTVQIQRRNIEKSSIYVCVSTCCQVQCAAIKSQHLAHPLNVLRNCTKQWDARQSVTSLPFKLSQGGSSMKWQRNPQDAWNNVRLSKAPTCQRTSNREWQYRWANQLKRHCVNLALGEKKRWQQSNFLWKGLDCRGRVSCLLEKCSLTRVNKTHVPTSYFRNYDQQS